MVATEKVENISKEGEWNSLISFNTRKYGDRLPRNKFIILESLDVTGFLIQFIQIEEKFSLTRAAGCPA